MKVIFSESFLRMLYRLEKKYPFIRQDLADCFENFDFRQSISIGEGVYKIRIGSRDMRKGKSGGFRSYCYFKWLHNLLVPFCIYAKNEKENLSQEELTSLLLRLEVEIDGMVERLS